MPQTNRTKAKNNPRHAKPKQTKVKDHPQNHDEQTERTKPKTDKNNPEPRMLRVLIGQCKSFPRPLKD